MAPSEHERATAWVTPALVIANTKAVSRQPEETSKLPIRTKSSLLGLVDFFCPKLTNRLRDKTILISTRASITSCSKLSRYCLVRKDKSGSPRLTILPKTAGLWVVGQFQRRLRNCHLHSFMAVCSPAAMACRMPGFWRISRRWRRLSRDRLGSRTNCTFLELVRRLDEEATLTIPLAQHKGKGFQSV